ncbi:MAG: four helix bundle protein [Inconstantimicrobium porci]|uniref:Four helix bundle protein n=1 Tax=Inconstantimicrobium porci TaxID=2652291 RepID=A0A7X2MZV7_9CLOT|nr:four helix bundle protein [Inconstantimicrobium porci]MDD6770354.1 four helix bundle protein [Inconstantimicrobium porci]MDY5911211.1 four helix bundle protein [Inconstantimicrobium porci]MSR92143.1 four helix bundle protein [Inconstantimicrobium porci]
MKDNLVYKKSYTFSTEIVNLYKKMTTIDKEFVLSKQLVRSGTSICANITEAVNSASRAEFIFKLNISLKEAKETEYWINLLKDTNYITNQESYKLLASCTELCRILSSIIHTCNNSTK